MGTRISVLGGLLLLACTANDGTQRSEFYPVGTATGTAPPPAGCTSDAQCQPGQRCFVGQCYGVVTCSTSLDCYNSAPPELSICNATRGECVMCNTDADCLSAGSGTICNPSSFECVP